MPDDPSPNTLTLTAEDGHAFAAYVAGPDDDSAPGLVVIQEIFGVNPHIRAVCVDRVHRGIELEYGEKGFKVGVGLRQLIPLEYSMMDLAACVTHLAGPRKFGGAENQKSTPLGVAVVGYCWGGTLAWVAAQRLDIRASVGYYGGGITGHLDGDLYCPVMLHFGGDDAAITPGDILTILKAYPQAKIHSYPGAGHGFNREPDAEYTGLALERTLEFLGK